MSFDEQPDGDMHGECAIEIARLEAEVDRLNTRILNTVHMIDAGSTKGQIRLNLTAALDDGKRHQHTSTEKPSVLSAAASSAPETKDSAIARTTSIC